MLFPEAFLGSWKGKDKSGPGCDARCWPFLRQLRPQRERVSVRDHSPLWSWSLAQALALS